MSSINFRDIFLSSDDLSLLSSARYGAVINIHPASAKFLIEYEFITHYSLSTKENEFVITPLGSRYLEYLGNILLKNSKEELRLKIIEIRSWIAIIISVIALVESFIS